MNKHQYPHNLTRRLAVILIVSVFNCVASPLLLGIRGNVEAAAPHPFDEPTSFIRRIPLTTNDLVYSSTTGKIYASIPGNVGGSGNSIATIDPATGSVIS